MIFFEQYYTWLFLNYTTYGIRIWKNMNEEGEEVEEEYNKNGFDDIITEKVVEIITCSAPIQPI